MPRVLPACLLAYAAASLFHHVHNAAFLDQYPNMPAWLSPMWVHLAWLGTTAIGFGGYVLLRRGCRISGIALLIVYGCYGLDALAHYLVAPVSAHTLAMNISIGLEAATAVAVLLALAVNLRTDAALRP